MAEGFEDEIVVPAEEKEEEENTKITLAEYYRLFRDNREFSLYAASSCITYLAHYIPLIPTIDMIEEFEGATQHMLYISIMIVFKQGPTGLFSSLFLGGALADARERVSSMFWLNILSIFMALLHFFPLYYRSIAGTLAVVACYGFVLGIFEPPRGAILPAMFENNPTQLRMSVVITITLIQGVMGSIGAAVGGVVKTYYGYGACFILNSFVFLIAALILTFMKTKYIPQNSEALSTATSSESHFAKVIRMTREGVVYCRQNFWGPLVLFRGAVAFQFGAMDVLLVNFSTSLSGNSTLNLAWLFFTVGVGSFIGPVALTRDPTVNNIQYCGIVGALVIFFGIAGMAITNSILDQLWSVCIFNAMRASGAKILGVNGRLLLNKFPEDGKMGRVMSLEYVNYVAMVSASAMTVGVLEDIVGFSTTNTTLVIGGCLSVSALFWIYFHSRGGGGASPEATVFDTPKTEEGTRQGEGDAEKADGEREEEGTKDEPPHKKQSIGLALLWMGMMFVVSVGVVFTCASGSHGSATDIEMDISETEVEHDASTYLLSDFGE